MSKNRVWHLIFGMRDVFNIGSSELEVLCSGLTGLETVSLDGKVVSKRRSFSQDSEHVFMIGSCNYVIEISSKGDAIKTVTLRENGVIAQRNRLFIPLLKDVDKEFFGRRFWRWAIMGTAILLGFLTYIWVFFELDVFVGVAALTGTVVGFSIFFILLLPAEYRIEVDADVLSQSDAGDGHS